MNDHQKIPRVARIWRGRTRRDRADEYEAYNYEAGIRPLIEKAMGVQTLREDRAGEPTRIHHLERDPEFLIELPQRVQILDLRTTHGYTGSVSP
jgi:hypothetical protein